MSAITRTYGRTKTGQRIRRSRIEVYANITTTDGGYHLLDSFVVDLPGNLCRMTDLGSVLAAQIRHDCPQAIAEGIEHIDVLIAHNGRGVAQRGFWPIND